MRYYSRVPHSRKDVLCYAHDGEIRVVNNAVT